MNAIVNKFLLAAEKVMPEIHLRQLEFTYSACGPCTKNKEKNPKIYRNARLNIHLSKRIR